MMMDGIAVLLGGLIDRSVFEVRRLFDKRIVAKQKGQSHSIKLIAATNRNQEKVLREAPTI